MFYSNESEEKRKNSENLLDNPPNHFNKQRSRKNSFPFKRSAHIIHNQTETNRTEKKPPVPPVGPINKRSIIIEKLS